MPFAAQRPCLRPGCRSPATEGGWCDRHRPKRPNDKAGPSPYNYRWQKVRAVFIAQNPVCTTCGDLATDVDHVVPHKGHTDPLFWDTANYQALCHACHSRKTRRQSRST